MAENKRYIDGGEECTENQFLIDTETDEGFFIDHGLDKIIGRLNEQEEQIKNLKETIIKITIAYQRKHDNTIVNLIDEVYEEDIRDLFTEWNLKPFINLAEDYNLTLNQLFDICSECIDKLDSTYKQKEYSDVE